MHRRIEARQQPGHRNARTLPPDDDCSLARDHRYRIVNVQAGACKRRRADPDRSRVTPPRYFARTDQTFGNDPIS